MNKLKEASVFLAFTIFTSLFFCYVVDPIIFEHFSYAVRLILVLLINLVSIHVIYMYLFQHEKLDDVKPLLLLFFAVFYTALAFLLHFFFTFFDVDFQTGRIENERLVLLVIIFLFDLMYCLIRFFIIKASQIMILDFFVMVALIFGIIVYNQHIEKQGVIMQNILSFTSDLDHTQSSMVSSNEEDIIKSFTDLEDDFHVKILRVYHLNLLSYLHYDLFDDIADYVEANISNDMEMEEVREYILGFEKDLHAFIMENNRITDENTKTFLDRKYEEFMLVSKQ
jgi:hypothetical protein